MLELGQDLACSNGSSHHGLNLSPSFDWTNALFHLLGGFLFGGVPPNFVLITDDRSSGKGFELFVLYLTACWPNPSRSSGTSAPPEWTVKHLLSEHDLLFHSEPVNISFPWNFCVSWWIVSGLHATQRKCYCLPTEIFCVLIVWSCSESQKWVHQVVPPRFRMLIVVLWTCTASGPWRSSCEVSSPPRVQSQSWQAWGGPVEENPDQYICRCFGEVCCRNTKDSSRIHTPKRGVVFRDSTKNLHTCMCLDTARNCHSSVKEWFCEQKGSFEWDQQWQISLDTTQQVPTQNVIATQKYKNTQLKTFSNQRDWNCYDSLLDSCCIWVQGSMLLLAKIILERLINRSAWFSAQVLNIWSSQVSVQHSCHKM